MRFSTNGLKYFAKLFEFSRISAQYHTPGRQSPYSIILQYTESICAQYHNVHQRSRISLLFFDTKIRITRQKRNQNRKYFYSLVSGPAQFDWWKKTRGRKSSWTVPLNKYLWSITNVSVIEVLCVRKFCELIVGKIGFSSFLYLIDGRDSAESKLTTGQDSAESKLTTGRDSAESKLTTGRDSAELKLTIGWDSAESKLTTGRDRAELKISATQDRRCAKTKLKT